MLRSFTIRLGILCTLLGMGLTPQLAQAEPLTVTQGPGALDYNMLFQGGQFGALPTSGTLLQARTNEGNLVIDVTSTSSLSVLGGHAGFAGSSGQIGDLTLSPLSNPPDGFEPLGGLNAMIFSLMASAPGDLSITALLLDEHGDESTFHDTFAFGSNGRQWFQLTAGDGYQILEVQLETLVNGTATPLISTFGHIRVELTGSDGQTIIPPIIAAQEPPPLVSHTPEPASLALWSLLLLGGAGAAYRPRRSRRP